MNKRTIKRRPLKVFCDKCWLCFYSCLISHRPANLPWLPWTGRWEPVAVSGVFFPCLQRQLQPGSCSFFWRPPSFLLPSLPLTIPALWPWGSPQTSDPSQTPLDPVTPWFAPGVKPSHLLFGSTDHFSWSLAPIPALVLFLIFY